jgi:hypothetical protein
LTEKDNDIYDPLNSIISKNFISSESKKSVDYLEFVDYMSKYPAAFKDFIEK